MKHLGTALVAAAGLLAVSGSANAQSYNDIRARALCLEVGATNAELPGCIQSVKTKMFLQNLGSVLRRMGRQPPPVYVDPHHPWIVPPVWDRHYHDNRQDCWLGHSC